MATILRSEPAPDTGAVAVSSPATSAETGGGPAHRPRPWWRRLPALVAPPPLEVQHACLEQVRALLEAAHTELSAGWVQGGWWSSDGGRHTVRNGLAAGASAGGPVSAACLVGALIRAGSGPGGDPETGRAIDAVYDALWESQGQPATTPGPGLLTVSSPRSGRPGFRRSPAGTTPGDVLAARCWPSSTGPSPGSFRIWRRFPLRVFPHLPSLDVRPVRGGPSRWARRPVPPAVRSRG